MPKKIKITSKINKARLFKELLVLALIVLVVLVFRFLPSFLAQPLPQKEPYYELKGLLHDVEAYDYSSGASPELEARIAKATETIDTEPVRYFFNQKARAVYLYHRGRYHATLVALDVATRFAPEPPEQNSIYELYVKTYTALGDTNNSAKYAELIKNYDD